MAPRSIGAKSKYEPRSRVAVVGGGNTAVEEALYMSHIAQHVTLIHRRDKLRAEKILQERLFREVHAGKISVVWNHTVAEVLGNEHGVTGAQLASLAGGGPQQLAVTGLFVAIGHTPNTALFAGQLEMRGGYLSVRSGLVGDVIPGVVAPSLAGLVSQEGPIAEPVRLRGEKLGQSREMVHPLNLHAVRLAIELLSQSTAWRQTWRA